MNWLLLISQSQGALFRIPSEITTEKVVWKFYIFIDLINGSATGHSTQYFHFSY